jgi:hypothetical protein
MSTLEHKKQRRKVRYNHEKMSIGGVQGIAMIVERT